MELTTRNQKLVLERAEGDTFEAIGERHAISYQRVQTVVREATEHINQIEIDLMVARKTDQVVSLLVPYQDQGDRQTALDYLDWVLARLKDRGVEVNVEHRPTTEGSIFFLSDVTDYRKATK